MSPAYPSTELPLDSGIEKYHQSYQEKNWNSLHITISKKLLKTRITLSVFNSGTETYLQRSILCYVAVLNSYCYTIDYIHFCFFIV